MAASLSEAELEAIKWDEAVIELYPQVIKPPPAPPPLVSTHTLGN